jgi:hypothetical protein
MMHRKKTPSIPVQACLDTDQAARYLNVSKSYITKLRCTGGGPRYAKIGRRVNYAIPDLDAWREKYVVMSTSQRPPEI